VLYGRKCRTPLSWSETGERKIFGPDLVVEAEDKVKVIQANLKTAQSRQKNYVDIVAEPLELFRLKCVIDRRTNCKQLNALQTEQSFGLSGLRPI
jgi:hypothetical protein